MEEIAARAAREQFSDLLNRVAFGGEQVVITRNGRPVAVLISAADYDQIRAASAG